MSEFFAENDMSINVSKRLRILREERKVSMRELARRSGLSANALSMIERGLTSPSVSTLNKLSNALEVPITAFFRSEPERHTIVFRKKSNRKQIIFPFGAWEGLGGESFIGRMECFMVKLEKGGNSGPYSLLHSGHEFVFCVSGHIEYEVDGQHFAMDPGDSLVFAAHMGHSWHNNNDEIAEAIIVISDFEDNERPSEFHLAADKISFENID